MNTANHSPNLSTASTTIPPRRQILTVALAMLAVTLLLAAIKTYQILHAISQAKLHGPPPEAVTTTLAKRQSWRHEFSTVGSFAAVKGATLSTQEGGIVTKIAFESGQRVEQGDLLVELDRSVEEATLTGALARLELAKQSLSRAAALKTQSALSSATFEDAESRFKQAEAEVRSIRGVIERKTIFSPFAGRVGIRGVNLGQYVNPGTPVVPLYTLNPIHFNFSIPQQIAPALRDSGEQVEITVDAFPGRSFMGRVAAVNPNINEVSRSVDVQALLSNESEELLPGMFGSLRMEIGPKQELIVVPITAVQYAPYGDLVYLLEKLEPSKSSEENKSPRSVRQQIVQLGERRGDYVGVIKGINEGDEVITLGAFKLRPGAKVIVSSEGQGPPAALKPEVKDS
jgi:membrane fusion protein (multidrug efflux system)